MSAAVKVYDLRIQQGVDYAVTFQYQNPDGSIFPFSNFTAKMQIKEGYRSVPYLTLTDTAGITMTPSIGEITVNITGAQTALLPGAPSALVYDLQITSNDNGVKYKVIGGKVFVELAVTD